MGKKKAQKTPDGRKIIARNRRARHDYDLELTVEAGIVLVGSEVKSLREGQVDLEGAFARIDGDEMWIVDLNIQAYSNASYNNHTPKRKRKLLLHRREIQKLANLIRAKGRTLIPLEIYFNEKGLSKLTLAVGVGRKQHDKRDALAKREARDEMQRVKR